MVKFNEALSDAIFELMFETLWVAPYDRRRHDAVWCEFDRCARKAVTLLSVSDLDALAGPRAAELGRTVELFLRSVERVGEAGLFPGMPARQAVLQARAICSEVWARCPAAGPERPVDGAEQSVDRAEQTGLTEQTEQTEPPGQPGQMEQAQRSEPAEQPLRTEEPV